MMLSSTAPGGVDERIQQRIRGGGAAVVTTPPLTTPRVATTDHNNSTNGSINGTGTNHHHSSSHNNKNSNDRSNTSRFTRVIQVGVLGGLALLYMKWNMSRVTNVEQTAKSKPTTTATTATPNNQQDGAIQSSTATITAATKIIRRDLDAFPTSAQMGWEQVESILSVLPEVDGNLLVWGLGNDSPFWHNTTTGRVIFLEDASWDVNLVNKGQQRWYDTITTKYPYLEAYAINYTTKNNAESFRRYMKQEPETWKNSLTIPNLPDIVFQIPWHVIVVDAPLGYNGMGPGRYQSLYMTHQIVERMLTTSSSNNQQRQNTIVHVFVDDYERKVERQFSHRVFNVTHGELPFAAVIKRPERARVPSNEQAHFIFMSSPNNGSGAPSTSKHKSDATNSGETN